MHLKRPLVAQGPGSLCTPPGPRQAGSHRPGGAGGGPLTHRIGSRCLPTCRVPSTPPPPATTLFPIHGTPATPLFPWPHPPRHTSVPLPGGPREGPGGSLAGTSGVLAYPPGTADPPQHGQAHGGCVGPARPQGPLSVPLRLQPSSCSTFTPPVAPSTPVTSHPPMTLSSLGPLADKPGPRPLRCRARGAVLELPPPGAMCLAMTQPFPRQPGQGPSTGWGGGRGADPPGCSGPPHPPRPALRPALCPQWAQWTPETAACGLIGLAVQPWSS